MRSLSAFVAVIVMMSLGPFATAESGEELLAKSGVRGGLVVHVGCGDGSETVKLRGNERYVVQGLDTSPANVAAARKQIRSQDLYGSVTAQLFDGKHLPYADNLVNLVVVSDKGDVSDAEIMRVLSPGGVAMIDGKKTVKPWPKEIDQWTHFMHGPDNNAVANDTRVEPPRYTQWVAPPRWGRSHDHLSGISAVVSANGRIFAIVDEGPIASVKADSKWMLVARDAFSGVLLWKQPIDSWEHQLRPFRSGPAEMPRRLVAVGDRVYVTLGYGQPVTALDAATGRLLRTYDKTDNAHEILCDDGKLFVVISDPLTDKSPTSGKVLRTLPVWRGFYGEYATAYMPKHVRVLDAESGKLLWKKEGKDVTNILPLTLLVQDGTAYFQNEDHLFACDAATGEQKWKVERPGPPHRYAWLVPTLVVHDGVVLSADRAADKPVDTGGTDMDKLEWRVSANHILTEGKLMAFDANSGKSLWSVTCHEGFNAPVDVFVIDGKVYTSALAWGKQPGITDVYDLHTGKVVHQRPPDQKTHTIGFGHSRCYRHKATTRYIVQGRAGVEFINLKTDKVDANHWVRGACQYGVVPCNGLLYAPTHPCACYITAKLSGFNALAGQRTPPVKDGEQLVKGPAFKKAAEQVARNLKESDWPTFRHDNARSGIASCSLAPELTKAWQTKLQGPLTAVSIADGRLYVAQRDEQTLHAISAAKGTPLWSYTAGGRIDSPPTVVGGLVYFGSADGWIYCVQAEDGALAWRHRVAPESRQVVSYDQLESVWPVHGTVLVEKNPKGRLVAYASAGRSSYIDGGVVFCAFDAITGELIARRQISHRDPETGLEPQNLVRGVQMPGALPDVLSSDGESIFMRHQRFDLEGNSLPAQVDHLFSSAGFVDDTWWHRTYLQIGADMAGGYGGWTSAGNRRLSGRALVTDGQRTFGFGRKAYGNTGSHLGMQGEHHLFAAVKPEVPQPAPKKKEPKKKPKGRRPAPKVSYKWSQAIPFYPRAMLLAGDTLFIGGAKKVEDFVASAPADDVLLWAVSTEDGSKKGEIALKAAPVHDSFAAAGGRLYFTTADGRVVCFAEK